MESHSLPCVLGLPLCSWEQHNFLALAFNALLSLNPPHLTFHSCMAFPRLHHPQLTKDLLLPPSLLSCCHLCLGNSLQPGHHMWDASPSTCFRSILQTHLFHKVLGTALSSFYLTATKLKVTYLEQSHIPSSPSCLLRCVCFYTTIPLGQGLPPLLLQSSIYSSTIPILRASLQVQAAS